MAPHFALNNTLWTRDGRIRDIQLFMLVAYNYWRHRGMWNAVQEKLIDFLNSFFICAATYTLLFLVNWELLLNCHTEACIAERPPERRGVLLPFRMYFFFSPADSTSFQHSFFYSLFGLTLLVGCLAWTGFEGLRLMQCFFLQREMQLVARGFVRGGTQHALSGVDSWLVRVRFTRSVAVTLLNAIVNSRNLAMERLERRRRAQHRRRAYQTEGMRSVEPDEIRVPPSPTDFAQRRFATVPLSRRRPSKHPAGHGTNNEHESAFSQREEAIRKSLSVLISERPFLGGRASQNTQLMRDIRDVVIVGDDVKEGEEHMQRPRDRGARSKFLFVSHSSALTPYGVEVIGNDSDVEMSERTSDYEETKRRRARRRAEYQALATPSNDNTRSPQTREEYSEGREVEGPTDTAAKRGKDAYDPFGLDMPSEPEEEGKHPLPNKHTREVESKEKSSSGIARRNGEEVDVDKELSEGYSSADDDPFILLDREDVADANDLFSNTHNKGSRADGWGRSAISSLGDLPSAALNSVESNPLVPHINDILWSDFLHRLCMAIRQDATALRTDRESFDELRAVQLMMTHDNFMIALHQPRVRGGETAVGADVDAEDEDVTDFSPDADGRGKKLRNLFAKKRHGGGPTSYLHTMRRLVMSQGSADASEEDTPVAANEETLGGVFRPHVHFGSPSTEHQEKQGNTDANTERVREWVEENKNEGRSLEDFTKPMTKEQVARAGLRAAVNNSPPPLQASSSFLSAANKSSSPAFPSRGESPPPEDGGCSLTSPDVPCAVSPPPTIVIDPPVIRRRAFRYCDENVLRYLVSGLFDELLCTTSVSFEHQHQKLSDTLLTLSVVSALAYPFIVAVFTTRMLVKNIVAIRDRLLELVGRREWSPTAQWTFRLYNEVPHLAEKRLRAGSDVAGSILESATLPQPLLRAVQRLASTVIFLCILVTFVNATMLTLGMVFDRSLLWWLSTAFIFYYAAAEPLREREYNHLADLQTLTRHIRFISPAWITSPSAFAADITDIYFPARFWNMLTNLGRILVLPGVLFYLWFVADADSSEVTMLIRFVRVNSVKVEGVGAGSSCLRAADFRARWDEDTVAYCCGWSDAHQAATDATLPPPLEETVRKYFGDILNPPLPTFEDIRRRTRLMGPTTQTSVVGHAASGVHVVNLAGALTSDARFISPECGPTAEEEVANLRQTMGPYAVTAAAAASTGREGTNEKSFPAPLVTVTHEHTKNLRSFASFVQYYDAWAGNNSHADLPVNILKDLK